MCRVAWIWEPRIRHRSAGEDAPLPGGRGVLGLTRMAMGALLWLYEDSKLAMSEVHEQNDRKYLGPRGGGA